MFITDIVIVVYKGAVDWKLFLIFWSLIGQVQNIKDTSQYNAP